MARKFLLYVKCYSVRCIIRISFVILFSYFIVVDHRIVLSIDQSRFRLVQNLNQLDVTSKDATADDQKAKEEKRGRKRSNKLSNRKVHFVIQLIYNKKEYFVFHVEFHT